MITILMIKTRTTTIITVTNMIKMIMIITMIILITINDDIHDDDDNNDNNGNNGNDDSNDNDNCERSLFFKYSVIPALRVFWGAPDFLEAYHVSCSLSGLCKSGFFYCWCK